MIESILATDMAKHFSKISSLKNLIKSKEICDGQNNQFLINTENGETLF